jgi:hypothetical protein
MQYHGCCAETTLGAAVVANEPRTTRRLVNEAVVVSIGSWWRDDRPTDRPRVRAPALSGDTRTMGMALLSFPRQKE